MMRALVCRFGNRVQNSDFHLLQWWTVVIKNSFAKFHWNSKLNQALTVQDFESLIKLNVDKNNNNIHMLLEQLSA